MTRGIVMARSMARVIQDYGQGYICICRQMAAQQVSRDDIPLE